MKKCIFYHWSEDKPHEGDCVYQEAEYEPKTVEEAKAFTQKYANGFAEGYHRGLQEGYRKARYPELCHCQCCRSHGELCH